MAWPTGEPTGQPTITPSSSPTAMPTNPTSRPTGIPTMQPTGQPTSSPTVYFVPGEALSNTDPFARLGTTTSFAGMILAGILFCCCVAMMCLWLYRRRKKLNAPDLDNLSPYEKWMRIEEMKKNGEDVAYFANESASNKWTQKFSDDGKDAERLDKLHTKHGVKLDRPGQAAREAKRRSRTSIKNPMLALQGEGGVRASEGVTFDDVYGGGEDDENFGNTWGDHHGTDQIPGADQLHSTHNPMFDEFSGEVRESAMAHMHDIYAQEEDVDGGFEGTWDEDGNFNYDEYRNNDGADEEAGYDHNYDYGDMGGEQRPASQRIARGAGSLTGTLRFGAAAAGGAGPDSGSSRAVRTSLTDTLQRKDALKRKSKRMSSRKSAVGDVSKSVREDGTENL